MKNTLLIVISLLLFTSCKQKTGSGNIVTETRPSGTFNAISVGGGFDVEVTIGQTTSVVVEADDNIIDHVDIQTTGGTLHIRTRDLHNYSNVTMKVLVTTPSLNSVNASASAEVLVENPISSTGKLSFTASSGASIKAEVDAPEIRANASSGASVTLTGKTRDFSSQASSGAETRAWNLLSENTTVQASSGSSARVHASVNLTATASSGSSITYHGAAKVNKTISSGASLNKND